MNTDAYLAGLPNFLAYFGVSIGLLLAFAFVYSLATPHPEFKLIREGKTAAAVAFGGSLLGFVMPLHSAVSHSVNLVDCTLWGVVAFVVQIATFFVLRFAIGDLAGRITRDEVASGVFVASVSIAVGLLNAACMT